MKIDLAIPALTLYAAAATIAQALPAGESADSLRQRFLSVTGIKEGAYVLETGPEACQEGHLRILKLDDSLTLMLGANPLVTEIGHDGTVREPDAISTSSVQFTDHQIAALRTSKEAGHLYTWKVSVQVAPNGFSYSRKIFDNKKQVREENCVLKAK